MSGMSLQKHVLVLQSRLTGNRAQIANSDMCLTILRAKDINHVVLDASDPENKDQRDRLFEISGVRGNYPQIFTVEKDRTIFLGDFSALQQMNEDGTIAELMNPQKGANALGSIQPTKLIQTDRLSPNSLEEEESAAESKLGEDRNDDSVETISISCPKNRGNHDKKESKSETKQGWAASIFESKQVEESKPIAENVSNDKESHTPSDVDEELMNAMRNFEEENERKKADEVKKYHRLIRILVVVVVVVLIVDLVLIFLLVLK